MSKPARVAAAALGAGSALVLGYAAVRAYRYVTGPSGTSNSEQVKDFAADSARGKRGARDSVESARHAFQSRLARIHGVCDRFDRNREALVADVVALEKAAEKKSIRGGYYFFSSDGKKIANKWDKYDVDAELRRLEEGEDEEDAGGEPRRIEDVGRDLRANTDQLEKLCNKYVDTALPELLRDDEDARATRKALARRIQEDLLPGLDKLHSRLTAITRAQREQRERETQRAAEGEQRNGAEQRNGPSSQAGKRHSGAQENGSAQPPARAARQGAATTATASARGSKPRPAACNGTGAVSPVRAWQQFEGAAPTEQPLRERVAEVESRMGALLARMPQPEQLYATVRAAPVAKPAPLRRALPPQRLESIARAEQCGTLAKTQYYLWST